MCVCARERSAILIQTADLPFHGPEEYRNHEIKRCVFTKSEYVPKARSCANEKGETRTHPCGQGIEWLETRARDARENARENARGATSRDRYIRETLRARWAPFTFGIEGDEEERGSFLETQLTIVSRTILTRDLRAARRTAHVLISTDVHTDNSRARVEFLYSERTYYSIKLAEKLVDRGVRKAAMILMQKPRMKTPGGINRFSN